MPSFNAGSIEATLDVKREPFTRGLEAAREQGRKFAGTTFTAKLGVDRTAMTRELQQARQQVRQFTSVRHKAKLGLDATELNRDLAKMSTSLTAMGRRSVAPKIRLDGGTRVITQLGAIEATLDRLDGRTVNIGVDIDGAAQTLYALRAINREIARTRDVNVRSRASGGVTSSVSQIDSSSVTSFGSAVGGAASKMQLLIGLVALLAPAIIPAFTGAAAAAGALVAIIGVVGVSVAALAAGLIGNVKGIMGARDALKQANQAVADAGKQAAAAQEGVAQATRGVQAAEQGLADARQAAASAVANAERQLEGATRAAEDAQAGLNQARQDAADRLADYRDQLRGAALDEEGAELAVRRARQTLLDALEDPNSTTLDKDEARQALDEALFRLDQVRKSRDELQEQAKKDRKAGVEGSDEVKAARDRLADANRGVADAQRGVDQAQADGARQVTAAQQQLADANTAAAKAAKENQNAVAALAAAQAAQAAATAKLSTPAAVGFMHSLDELKEAWKGFLAGTQDTTLSLASSAMDVLAKVLPKLVPLVNAVAPAFERIVDALGDWVDSPSFDRFMAFLIDHAPGMIDSLGKIAGGLGRTFGGLAAAFTPFAEDMLDGLADITDGWGDSAQALKDNPEFANFIAFVKDTGPQFLDTLGAIGGAFTNVGRALAPLSKPVLVALDSVFSTIGDMDPVALAVLIGIAGAIAAITFAPVAGTAIAMLGFGSALAYIHDKGGPAADVMDQIAKLLEPLIDLGERLAPILRDELREAWELLQPVMADFADFLENEFGPKWDEFWTNVGPTVEWLATYVGPAIAGAFTLMFHGAERALRMFGHLLDFVNGIFTGDIEKAMTGLGLFVLDAVLFIPRTLFDMWNELTKIITGTSLTEAWGAGMDVLKRGASVARDWVLDHLVRGPDSMLGRIRSGFETGMDGIAAAFDGLTKAVGTPVKIVVDYLYNKGIRAVVNAIPGVDNISPVDTSDWPSFARGGVLPGYSPGHDNHQFVSPTGGVLNLSGGEGILIPQATQQLGGRAGIDYLNKRAREGTLSLDPLVEQSHANGGVIIIDGEKLTKVAAAQLAVASQASGISMPVMQGSYEAPSSYSGTSHTGGGVMDTGPGNFTAQSWLRKVGFAAWGRNFAGAKTAGSGAHVHSVSLLDPTAAGNRQAAAYMAGGDGLGGRDYGPRPAIDRKLTDQVYDLLNLSPGLGGPASGTIGTGGGKNAFEQAVSDAIGGVRRVGGNVVGAGLDFGAGLKAVATLVAKAPGWIKKLTGEGGDLMRDMGKDAVDGGFRPWVNGKLPGSPMPKIFDTGGWLAPGGVAVNMGSTPEPVLTDSQWRSLSDVALEGKGGLTSGDVDRIVEAIESNRGVYAAVSSRGELEAAFEGIDRELRKKGGD